MCGIAGFIDFKFNSTGLILREMTDILKHRGPDGSDYHLDSSEYCQVGLGHRRLSIIDLSPDGAQPMHFNQYSVVFNGEIYNYKELKKNLEAKGHFFNTQSDTEVLLHAYDEWGVEAANKMVGMFAFVIYDKKQNEVVAFRDRTGIKPLYFYKDSDLLLFASELKSFHKHPGFKKKIDINAVASFFRHGTIPGDQSIFLSTLKLKAGHFIRVNLASKDFHIEQYWSIYDQYNRDKLTISFDEALEETERVFKKAFEYRMVADVPVGIFLSGGYDSTCVTALLQKGRTEKLKTFSIGMDKPEFDESIYARQIAEHLGTDHTEYHFTGKEAKELVYNLPEIYDEPFGDSSALPTILVSKLAREKVTVALSADGGDELFAGYKKYPAYLSRAKQLNKVPHFIRRLAYYTLNTASPVSSIFWGSSSHNHRKYNRLKEVLRDPDFKNLYAYSSNLFTNYDVKRFLNKEINFSAGPYRSDQLKEEYFSLLSYMMAIDYETYLIDDIMHKVDRASMSVSLEAREPFLDINLIQWAASLPDHFKVRNGVQKAIIRELVHKYVPATIMDRPKMGFAIPIKDWLKSSFNEIVHDYTDENFLREQELFDIRETHTMVDDFYNSKKVPPEKIWYLLIFQMWYKKWM